MKNFIKCHYRIGYCLAKNAHIPFYFLFFYSLFSISYANNLGMSTAVKIVISNQSGCENNPECQTTPQLSCETPEWQEADFTSVYHVGPGQIYATPNDVPWESIAPDSLIKIHWRSEPYRNKWVINVNASADSPVVVLGVPVDGQLPVISGENATTRRALDYWNEERALIKIGASSIPNNNNASHITLACLDLKSAKPSYQFTNDSGSTSTYSSNAAAVQIEQGEFITIKNCDIHDAGNGLFSTSNSSNILITGNHIWDNGIDGSIYQHNSYTESLGIIFEFNHYGALCQGCLGNNLKDRSAGTVIRYNWIEDGNRQLDLVDSDHSSLLTDSRYNTTYVYGNTLIEHEGQGNRQIVHYGGDSGDSSRYRKGVLHFYHNTIYSNRTRNTLLALSSNDETAELRNNIIFGLDLSMVDRYGIVNLSNNWLSAGWVNSHGSLGGVVNASGSIEGNAPGFVDVATNDFHLAAGSACLNRSGTLANDAVSHPVSWEFSSPQGVASKGNKQRISLDDLGAYNYGD